MTCCWGFHWRLVVVVVGRFHVLRQPMQKKICVLLDEHEGFRLGQPPARRQDRLCRAGGRGKRRILLQGPLRRRKALGMDILQHGEKQQLLGIKEFIKRSLGYPNGICQLLHGGFPHPDGNAATPRFEVILSGVCRPCTLCS